MRQSSAENISGFRGPIAQSVVIFLNPMRFPADEVPINISSIMIHCPAAVKAAGDSNGKPAG